MLSVLMYKILGHVYHTSAEGLARPANGSYRNHFIQLLTSLACLISMALDNWVVIPCGIRGTLRAEAACREAQV